MKHLIMVKRMINGAIHTFPVAVCRNKEEAMNMLDHLPSDYFYQPSDATYIELFGNGKNG